MTVSAPPPEAVTTPPADALRKVGWQVEEPLPLPLPGRFFVFGRLGAGEGAPAARDVKVSGRTGLGWEFPVLPGAEVLLRSGPTLSCTGLPSPGRVLEDSQLLVEVQYRWRLLSWAGLEYQGTAFPALGVAEQMRLEHDLGLVFPLGQVGQFRVGTRHSGLHSAPVLPWTENLQFQLGSSLRW